MSLPRISIVTPSMNQAAYLASTMESVLKQGYPSLEYIVVDGGSNDGSVGIIKKYVDRLAWWVSEPDKGQYDAINKGFAQSMGEIMGWLNSDDMYFPWTLSVVGEIFALFPQVEWITTKYPLIWDDHGRVVNCGVMSGLDRVGFMQGDALPCPKWGGRVWIQQESTFWRRSLWDKAGGVMSLSYPLAADFELWARFIKRAELVRVATPLAGFRMHKGQKTDVQFAQYIEDADHALTAHGGAPIGVTRQFLRSRVWPNLTSWWARRLLGWCGGNPRYSKVCQCDLRSKGWTVKQVWE